MIHLTSSVLYHCFGRMTTKINYVAIRCVHRQNNCGHVLMLQQMFVYGYLALLRTSQHDQ